VGLVNGDSAGLEHRDAICIDVRAGDFMTCVGKACTGDET